MCTLATIWLLSVPCSLSVLQGEIKPFNEVGIDGFAANVAIPGIARKSQIVTERMPGHEIERRGTIGRAIGHRIRTRVIRVEQPVILNAVALQRIVGIRHGERQVRFTAAPAQAREALPDVGHRSVAPARLVKSNVVRCAS
jgi:hypothetical protein